MDRTCWTMWALCAAGLALAWLAAPRTPRPAEAGAGAPVLVTWASDAKQAGPATEPAR